MEALHKAHEYNDNGLIMYRDELKGWLASMNSYRKGSDEETWLEIFNNKVATIGRVTKDPVRIDNSFVNVIGTIQDSVLSDIISKENGLVERFLFTKTYKEIKPLSRLRMNQDNIDYLYNSIRELHDNITRLDEFILDMSDDVYDKVIDADNRIISLQTSGIETDKFVGYLSKMRTYLPRFILIIGLIDCFFNSIPIKITDEHVENASKLLDYYIKSARRLFSDISETKELSDIIASLYNKSNKEKIQLLTSKGFSQIKIAKGLGLTKGRVSQILNKKFNKV